MSVSSSQGLTSRRMEDLAMRAGFFGFFLSVRLHSFFLQFGSSLGVFIIVGCEEIDIIIIVSCSSCGGSGRSGGNFGAGEFAGLGTERLDVVVPAQGMSVRAGGGSSQSGKRGYIGLRWSITFNVTLVAEEAVEGFDTFGSFQITESHCSH